MRVEPSELKIEYHRLSDHLSARIRGFERKTGLRVEGLEIVRGNAEITEDGVTGGDILGVNILCSLEV